MGRFFACLIKNRGGCGKYVCQLSIFRAGMGTKEEFEKVFELVVAGNLGPIIDRVFSLNDVAEEQKQMAERKDFDKIVLELG